MQGAAAWRLLGATESSAGWKLVVRMGILVWMVRELVLVCPMRPGKGWLGAAWALRWAMHPQPAAQPRQRKGGEEA